MAEAMVEGKNYLWPMRFLFSCLLVVTASIYLLACKNEPAAKPLGKGPFDPKDYIDVNSHLVYELREVMRTPYFMWRITYVDGKRDSAQVESPEFARWQTRFFLHNMLAGDTATWYRETSFGDTSTGFITTSYTAEHASLPIRQISVLSSPESGNIKHIYLDKQYSIGDTSVLEKLGWTAGKSLLINRSTNVGRAPAHTVRTELHWQ